MASERHFDERPGVAGNGSMPPRDDPGSGTSNVQPDRDALYGQIRDTLASPGLHDEEIQYELARWLHLLETREEQLREGRRPKALLLAQLARKGEAAIAALLSDKPELVFARTLRIRAEVELLRRNGLLKRHLVSLTDGSPVLTVGLGALTAMVLGLAGHLVAPLIPVPNPIPLADANTPIVAGAAYIGGVVSILGRLTAFSKLRDFDPAFLFLNALFKPFLGLIFGVFAYAVWQSGMLPLHEALTGEATPHQLWVVGFLAGFSERFTNDLISRSEGLMAPPAKGRR
jgi:hypothetical protein